MNTCIIDGCTNPVSSHSAKTCGPAHSTQMRNNRVREWQRAKYQKRPKTPRRCKRCGVEYLAHKGFYCSDLCRDRAQAARKAAGVEWVCSKCATPMPERKGKPGVRVCPDCLVDPRDPVKQAAKERTRTLRKYGLTQTDWDRMLDEQGHRCAICHADEPDEGSKRTWRIDHCHATGVVRGLLCNRCNLALGYFRDNPALLRMAAHYLTLSQHRSPDA